jgi:hypothetical protein
MGNHQFTVAGLLEKPSGVAGSHREHHRVVRLANTEDEVICGICRACPILSRDILQDKFVDAI